MFAELRKKVTVWLPRIALICLWLCSCILPFDCIFWPCLLLFIVFRKPFWEILAKGKG